MLYNRIKYTLLFLVYVSASTQLMGMFSVRRLLESSGNKLGFVVKTKPHFTKRLTPKLLLGMGIGSGIGYWLYSFNEQCQDGPLFPEDPLYSINLMWLNSHLNSKQSFICPADRKEELTSALIGWDAKTPHNYPINLWYDSRYASKEALEATKQIVNKQYKDHPEEARINLVDIRDLECVKTHPNIFSEKIPVYFRTDLARVAAAVETLETSDASYFVYADLDMTPLSQEELCDKETIQNLNEFGIVMAHSEKWGFENGFFMMSKDSKKSIEASKVVLINLSLARAYNALQGKFCIPGIFWGKRCNVKLLEQTLYRTYGSMFAYLYYLKGDVDIKNYSTKHYYESKQDGLKPFNTKGIRSKFEIENKSDKQLISKEHKSWLPLIDKDSRVFVPTKRVPIPPSHFQ